MNEERHGVDLFSSHRLGNSSATEDHSAHFIKVFNLKCAGVHWRNMNSNGMPL